MKLKTHKGLKKRIKITKGGKGKLLRGHVQTSHLKTKQSRKTTSRQSTTPKLKNFLVSH